MSASPLPAGGAPALTTVPHRDPFVANPSTPYFYTLACQRQKIVVHVAVTLPVEWTVTALQMDLSMTFGELKRRLAQRWQLRESNFQLFLGDTEVNLSDTPASKGWQIGDEGIILDMARRANVPSSDAIDEDADSTSETEIINACLRMEERMREASTARPASSTRNGTY